MAVLQTEAIRNLGWEDATFHGFAWGDDLTLTLLLVHASADVSKLTCHWVSDMKVDLNWARPGSDESQRRGGPLLARDCGITAASDGRWNVTLDFGSDGQVTFECEKITAVAGEPSNKALRL